MAWKEVSLAELADDLGLDYREVKEKHKLITRIKKIRKDRGLSQSELADMVGLSQSRIARIEGGVGTKNMSFDLLFRVLSALGYECRVSVRRATDLESEAA
jgi:transcriptional regulator with XRE-family HTH domain